MSGELTKTDLNFREVIHRLRYWLAMKNIRDRGKVVVEVHFPDAQSQHEAMYSLRRETSYAEAISPALDPYRPMEFKIEGIKVIFTNPDRLDRR